MKALSKVLAVSFAILILLSACGQSKLRELAYDNKNLAQGELVYEVPGHWQKYEAESPFRKAQYLLPGLAGLSVYFFEGDVGGIPANLERWGEQFQDDKDKIVGEVKQFNMGKLPITIASYAGTYRKSSDSMNPEAPKNNYPNYAMQAAVVELADGSWFFKMLGPKVAVDAEQEHFNNFVHSFKLK